MLDELIAEEQAAKKKASQPRTALDDLIEQDAANQQQTQSQANTSDPGFLATVKPAILPTLGNTVGAVAGSLTGPFAPAAVPTLEAAGGMLGEYANQKLGITPPSTAAIATQGIVPAALRGISLASKVLPPNTNGATFLNEIAPREATYQLGKLGITPGQASAKMSAATANNTMIPATGVREAIQQELGKMGGGAGADIYGKTAKHLKTLDDSLYAKESQLTPEQYQKELRDIRARLTQNGESRPNQVEKAALLNVKSAMEDALSNNTAGQRLTDARKDILRESVFNDLNDLSFNANKNIAHSDLTQFNARPILDKIEGRGGKANEAFQRRFQAAFTPDEQKSIHSLYKKLNTFDKMQPGTGVNAGSMRVLQPLIGGAALGGASTLAGASPTMAGAIGAASMAIPPVLHAGRTISLAMSTHEGRKALGQILADPKVKTWGALLPRLTLALSATEPVQTGIRSVFDSGITPFHNQE